MLGLGVIGLRVNFNMTYIVAVAILGAAALVDLQLKLANFRNSSVQLEQWKTIVILSVASAIARYLTSTVSKERAVVEEKLK